MQNLIELANGSKVMFMSNRPNKNKRVYSPGSFSRGKRGLAGSMALSMLSGWGYERSYPVNVVYDQTFVQMLKRNRDVPVYVRVMAPYLDWVYENRPFMMKRKEFLYYRAKPESRFTVYPRWIDEWELKAIQFLKAEYESKRQLDELYRIFKGI
jgi:hypothetical protein